MSYVEDFEQWKGEIESIPLDEIKLPDEPIDDFVARTETLAVNANEDRELLEGAGLDVVTIDQLPPLSGALRYCQAQWMSEYQVREEAKIEWREKSPHAYVLRDELLHHFSFAYRGSDDMKKKIARLREGASNADMVQDLLELAVLGTNNPDPLTTIKFDLDLLPQARTESYSLAKILAAANGAEGEDNKIKKLRDQAFTLLSQKESTIREYGRYIFWKNDDKKSKYSK